VTSAPAASASSIPVITSPLDDDSGYPREASTTVTAQSSDHAISAPSSPDGRAEWSSSSSASERSRGRIAWVSGSPKRALNSSTFAPAAVIISPA
jgi:hypothetical protein